MQYIIFAVFNFLFVPIIYFFCVETKKRSLEELDVIFAAGGNPVKQEKNMPHNMTIEESRRVLGLDDRGTTDVVVDVFEHDSSKS